MECFFYCFAVIFCFAKLYCLRQLYWLRQLYFSQSEKLRIFENKFLSFRAKWGRSKFCKMQNGDGANFAKCKVGTERLQIGDGAMPCVYRLQRPAHGPKFARISECRLLSFRHFVPPPSSDGGFFGGSKPTALQASPCKAGFHHAVISSERSEDFIAERFHLPVAGCVKTRYLDA